MLLLRTPGSGPSFWTAATHVSPVLTDAEARLPPHVSCEGCAFRHTIHSGYWHT